MISGCLMFPMNRCPEYGTKTAFRDVAWFLNLASQPCSPQVNGQSVPSGVEGCQWTVWALLWRPGVSVIQARKKAP